MCERWMQIELDAVVVLEHLEADGVFAADEFLFRIDANIEMVVEQIVISAIGAVCAAQDVGARCPVRRNHGCGEYQEQAETTEREEEFQMRTTVQPRIIYRPDRRWASPRTPARR